VRAVLMTFVHVREQYARKFYPEEVERHLNPPAPTEGDAGGTAADARPDGTAAEEPSSADSAEPHTLADSNTAAAADSKEETGTAHGPTPPSDKPRERAPKLFNIFDSGGPPPPPREPQFHFGSPNWRCKLFCLISSQESAGCSSCR
jgi:hypothetical protein